MESLNNILIVSQNFTVNLSRSESQPQNNIAKLMAESLPKTEEISNKSAIRSIRYNKCGSKMPRLSHKLWCEIFSYNGPSQAKAMISPAFKNINKTAPFFEGEVLKALDAKDEKKLQHLLENPHVKISKETTLKVFSYMFLSNNGPKNFCEDELTTNIAIAKALTPRLLQHRLKKEAFISAAGGGLAYQIITLSLENKIDFTSLMVEGEQTTTVVNVALYIAIQSGYSNIVELLLRHPNLDLLPNEDQVQMNLNQVFFTAACKGGDVKVIKMLMEDHRIDQVTDYEAHIISAAENGRGEALLFLYKDTAFQTRVRNFITNGAAVEVIHTLDRILELALEFCPSEVVIDLLKEPLTNEIGWNFEAYLRRVCEFGNEKVISFLLNHPRMQEHYYYAAFYESCRFDHEKIVTQFLQNPSFNHVVDASTLDFATKYGHACIVRLLLKDPRIDPRDNDYRSILELAEGEFESYRDDSHKEIIREFLADERVDPGVILPEVLIGPNVDFLEILLSHPRVQPNAKELYEELVKTPSLEKKIILLNCNCLVQDPELGAKVLQFYENELYELCAFNQSTALERLLTSVSKVSWDAESLPLYPNPKITSLLLKHAKIQSPEQANRLFRNFLVVSKTEAARWLLHNYPLKPYLDNGLLFIKACEYGFTEAVKLWLQDRRRINPAANKQEALRLASKNGHIEIVKLLLADRRVKPQAKESEALRKASRHGYIKIVKLLLADPRVQPQAKNYQALRKARKYERYQIQQLLFEHSGVDPLANDRNKNKVIVEDLDLSQPIEDDSPMNINLCLAVSAASFAVTCFGVIYLAMQNSVEEEL